MEASSGSEAELGERGRQSPGFGFWRAAIEIAGTEITVGPVNFSMR